MKTKHSVLPWKTNEGDFRTNGMGEFIEINDRDGEEIAHIMEDEPNGIRKIDRANANFIIRACNNHYQLLEACKKALKIINNPFNEKKMWIHDVETILKQAIVKEEE